MFKPYCNIPFIMNVTLILGILPHSKQSSIQSGNNNNNNMWRQYQPGDVRFAGIPNCDCDGTSIQSFDVNCVIGYGSFGRALKVTKNTEPDN